MALPSFLTGRLWKVATGAAAVIALVLTVMLATTIMQSKDLAKQRDMLASRISDPVNGYVAQLAQARTNVETLTVEVERQNAAYDKLSVESQSRLAAAQARLTEAQAATKTMERKLAGFLATGPKGTTLEARVRDIDERAMKEFLP
jgi:hypothetical protein